MVRLVDVKFVYRIADLCFDFAVFSNGSEMYFRKMGPSPTCLYSAASIRARSLSAAAGVMLQASAWVRLPFS